ncbi:hypothetical protein GGF32_004308 [Allomyces javanicus]|nr:hypothetical protein GGF32_004308 [Allomyces javanicus]
MAQITDYALDVSIKMDTIRVTATVNDDKTTLYTGLISDLTAEHKDALVSLFTLSDNEDKAETLPREATFHAKFSAPAGVPLDVAGFVKAVLEHCGDDEDDGTGTSAARDAPDMAGMPPRDGMPGVWGQGGMRGCGGFRGMWGGRGGFRGVWGGRGWTAGMMGRGGMGPGGLAGFSRGFSGHQGPSGEHGPHQGPFGAHGPNGAHGPHGTQFGPGAPWGGAHRMPGQWQYQGKTKHGAIALTMDIREI